jgi:hypothetical protein
VPDEPYRPPTVVDRRIRCCRRGSSSFAPCPDREVRKGRSGRCRGMNLTPGGTRRFALPPRWPGGTFPRRDRCNPRPRSTVPSIPHRTLDRSIRQDLDKGPWVGRRRPSRRPSRQYRPRGCHWSNRRNRRPGPGLRPSSKRAAAARGNQTSGFYCCRGTVSGPEANTESSATTSSWSLLHVQSQLTRALRAHERLDGAGSR